MTDTLFKCTPRKTKEYVINYLQAGLVPFIQSSPGMGKSSIIRQIGKELGLKVITHNLATSDPTDLSGFPKLTEDKASFVPFDIFPTKNTPLPEGKNGWILFLDEFNAAIPKAVQIGAYKLILDRQIGQHDLHDNVLIVTAGNLATDRAITTPLSTAMQSRLVHLEMIPHLNSFLEDVAFPNKWDSRIIAYLNYRPDRFYRFNPDHKDRTFDCPRTWEFMNKLLSVKTTVEAKDSALFTGVLSSETAIDFMSFTRLCETIPNVKDIVNNPSMPAPSESGVKYAVICHLITCADENNFDPIIQYISKFNPEMKALFIRGVATRLPFARSRTSFQTLAAELARYLDDR